MQNTLVNYVPMQVLNEFVVRTGAENQGMVLFFMNFVCCVVHGSPCFVLCCFLAFTGGGRLNGEELYAYDTGVVPMRMECLLLNHVCGL